MTRYYLSPGEEEGERPSRNLPRAWVDRAGALPPTGAPHRNRPFRAVLRRRLSTILLGFLAVVALIAAVTFVLPPRFESTASFLIEEPSTTAGPTAALAVLERLGRSGTAETEIALLRSHSVIEPVADLLDLHVTAKSAAGDAEPGELLPAFDASRDAVPGRYEIAPAGTRQYVVRGATPGDTLLAAAGSQVTLAGLSWQLPDTAIDAPIALEVLPFGRVIERLQKRLHVRAADANAEVILLTCSARTAAAAQRLCRELSDSYVRLRSTLQRAEASAAATFLEGQVDEVVGQLTAAEEQMRRYARSTRSVALDVRARGEVDQFISIKAQREGLAAELQALRALVGEVEHGGGDVDYRRLASFPTFMKSQNQIVPQLLESLVQLENRRSELALRRSEQNPDLIAVNQRIAEIQSQLRSIAATYQQGLAAQVASLDETLARAGSELEAIPTQEIEVARLRRQVTLLEELHHFLQTRLKEAQVAEAVNLPSVRVVDRASLPFKAASPNVPLNLGLAAVLGIGFGAMLGLYREYSDTRIYERQEVEQGLGIPVVGMVARLDEPGPIASLSTAETSRALIRTTRIRQMELAWEAFHGLTTDLRFARSASSEGKPRSVAVTSTSRGEGKTFTACNLAIAWASYPASVLIIDADLRGAAVSRFFGMPTRAPGVAEVLMGTSAAEEALREVEPSPGIKVHVLPAGRYPGRFAELFDTDALEQLLHWAESRFDLVIVDTPPLNVLSDTAAIAARVDAVLVVVRGGATDRLALDMTLRRLERSGAHLEGIVLNDVELPGHYVRYSKLAV